MATKHHDWRLLSEISEERKSKDPAPHQYVCSKCGQETTGWGDEILRTVGCLVEDITPIDLGKCRKCHSPLYCHHDIGLTEGGGKKDVFTKRCPKCSDGEKEGAVKERRTHCYSPGNSTEVCPYCHRY